MDVRDGLVVVATTDKNVRAYDASDLAGGQPRLVDSSSSSLEWPYTSVAIFTDGSGYAIGSIEGRVTIKYLLREEKKTFTFKCHRKTAGKNVTAFPVNALAFHQNGTFVTGGGDGAPRRAVRLPARGSRFRPWLLGACGRRVLRPLRREAVAPQRQPSAARRASNPPPPLSALSLSLSLSLPAPLQGRSVTGTTLPRAA